MNILLVSIIISLAFFNLYQFYSKRKRDKQLVFIINKLSSLNNHPSSERVLLFTDDIHLQSLLHEINRLFDEKQNASTQFGKTERSMKKMLANISHDLKTPLTVILGYIEIIQNDPSMESVERERLLQKAYSKTIEIIELMNKFFDLAKLESGDKDLPLSRVHMNELCKRNILSFYDWVESKGFKAVIEIPEESIFATGNEEALDRILQNLLSNAIQYGEAGRVVGVRLACEEKNVFIDIWDRGKGIMEREQEHVFERMYTLEESRNKSSQGSGLGLTITKRLVEQIGGSIILKSTPFERTTFTVKLQRSSF